jgi:hypothetical protein
MQDYVKALNLFYIEHEALWELDCEPEGFEWTNCSSYRENVISFVRHSEYEEDDILVICNFTPVAYDSFDVVVPYHGVYTEEFNSDNKDFGGTGMLNVKPVTSTIKIADKADKINSVYGEGNEDKKDNEDIKTEIISIKLPPLSMIAFSMKKVEAKTKKTVKTTRKSKAAKSKK